MTGSGRQEQKEKITAIVLAGGTGSRMHSEVPKQYLPLGGYPLIWYSLQAFEKSAVDSIILVCPHGETDYCRREIIERYGLMKVHHVVEGGRERYHSVYAGLCQAMDSDYVLIHDGARPCVTPEIIEANLDAVRIRRACVTGVPSKDTIKAADDDARILYTPPRKSLWITQTPQSFETKLICEAYEKLLLQEEISVTDDAMVVETMTGQAVYFVEGDYRNIKVTTPEDLLIAETFLTDRMVTCV